jgi:hypothetical protein
MRTIRLEEGPVSTKQRIRSRSFVLCLTVAAIGVATLVAAGPAPGFGDSNSLVAHMNGQKAVPKGDPDAKGTAKITLKPRAGKVCFDITFTGLSPDNPFAGHIHKGAAGVAGPIKITFYEGAPRPSPWTGCTKKGVTDALLNRIRSHPERFYVNLHNMQFPNGAIRGQLRQ